MATDPTDIVQLLLDKGADPNIKEPVNGYTALMFAVLEGLADIV